MFTLRCTRKLLTRMRAAPEAEDRIPTTALGDWYANLLFFGRRQVILAASERCLLPVLIEARGSARLAEHVVPAVAAMLEHIGVGEHALAREIGQMAEARVARTQSRAVLGVMNDMVNQLEFEFHFKPDLPLDAHARFLAFGIYNSIRYRKPAELARELIVANTDA